VVSGFRTPGGSRGSPALARRGHPPASVALDLRRLCDLKGVVNLDPQGIAPCFRAYVLPDIDLKSTTVFQDSRRRAWISFRPTGLLASIRSRQPRPRGLARRRLRSTHRAPEPGLTGRLRGRPVRRSGRRPRTTRQRSPACRARRRASGRALAWRGALRRGAGRCGTCGRPRAPGSPRRGLPGRSTQPRRSRSPPDSSRRWLAHPGPSGSAPMLRR